MQIPCPFLCGRPFRAPQSNDQNQEIYHWDNSIIWSNDRIQISPVVSIISFASISPPDARFTAGPHIAFNFPMSLVTFNLEWFPSPTLSLMILTFLEKTDYLFCSHLFNLFFPDVPSWFDSGHALFQKCYVNDAVLFPVGHIGRHRMLVCVISNRSNLITWLKWRPPGFFPVKLLFPL